MTDKSISIRNLCCSGGRRWHRATLVLALSAAFAVTSACGQSGRSGAGAPAAATDSVKINLGEISSAVSHTPIYVAINQGYFRKAGLDVSMQTLSGGTPAAMAALATGSVNVMNAGAAEFIEYVARKVISGKVIGESVDATFDIVVAKGIASIQQLRGKIIGTSGQNGADQIYFEAVLQHYGVSEKEVTFVTSGNPTNRLTAFSVGAVQAIAASNASRDTSLKVGAVLLKSNDSPIQIPAGLFFANDEMISHHRAEMIRFMAALGEASMWVRANPEAAVADCMKGTGLTAEACRSGIAAMADPAMNSRYTWSSTGAVNTAGIEAALAIEATVNPETRGLTVADLADTSIAGATP